MSSKVTDSDRKTIAEIAVRWTKVVEEYQLESQGCSPDILNAVMDLTAAHTNGCPLDLGGLLEADTLDFTHDISGIAGHLDRSTGKLINHFLPRYSVQRR
jgi:hypothetical protein